MKTISIKYNPYKVTTEILVDGVKPKPNSSLQVNGKRLQEWVDSLPNILLDEYRDANVKVEFKGMDSDYQDIVAAFDANKDKINATFEFKNVGDINNAEKEINRIFGEIKNGPVAELRNSEILNAFEKARNSKFEVNVVATMSSGKSTLINALLGRQLMPAANEATTATIVKIIDTDQDNFTAVAYDKGGHEVTRIENVTLEDMKNLNDDYKVSAVDIYGKIPFVKSVGMKLVLVDTPGPNNSRDKNHEAMTYRMIKDSDKSLVLFVMNGQQLGINDEKILLDYICDQMKEGGKQGRERFIFAVNRVDAYSPKNEGMDCVERALKNVKSGLEERGIQNPNIFPVSALSALEYRIEDDEPTALNTFITRSKKYDALKFNTYYHYSNLPQGARKNIDALLEKVDDMEKVEIYSGIISIEQAIAQYVNKYARVTKVCDLVSAFQEKLKELSTVAHYKEEIRKDKTKKAELDKKIAEIKAKINSAESAKNRSKAIDDVDLKPAVEAKVTAYINSLNNKLTKMMAGRSNKVEKRIAVVQCQTLEKECMALSAQIKVQVEVILKDAYKATVTKIIEEYKKYLAELNLGGTAGSLDFKPVNLVSSSLADLSSIIRNNTETEDESYTVRDSRTVKREGGFFRKAASFLSFGLVDDYTMETEYFDRKVEKYVDYVDMNEVASDYIIPFQRNLNNIRSSTIDHVVGETKRLKDHLKKELDKIDKVLNDKLSDLTRTEADSKAKKEEIEQKERNLRWMEKIQKEVNNIIDY
ncbi:MAG: hypothetical protein HDS42_00260 [Bacteroides sp.]|nr:hypothetical protein [Bacteroides sp.]